MPHPFSKIEIIDKFLSVHGNAYDYSHVNYINIDTPVLIKCNIHKDMEFLQTPYKHMRKTVGCKQCDFLRRAKYLHGNTYDYANTIVNRITDYVTIVCKTHGSFTQKAYSHLSGNGCNLCATTRIGIDKRAEKAKTLLDRFKNVHGDVYDYSSVTYDHSTKKVSITCKVHGLFDQLTNAHLKGSGCPKCSKKISKSEKSWLDELNVPLRQHKLSLPKRKRYWYVDGYDPETNTVYEFYGDYWHGNPKTFDQTVVNIKAKKTFSKLYAETIERERILRSAGYNLITIWESEYVRK